VAISGDGKNLLFAEGLGSFRVPPGDLTISVGIYQRDAANGTWSLGSGFETLARAGWSGKEFFLATDAKTILAYSTVFAKDNAGEWQEVADLSGSVPAINSASTLAANGTTAAIATKASGADYSVRVFDRDSGGTWRESAVLTAGDGVNGDSFGHDMAFSAAGDIALVGAPDDDDNGTDSGSAYVFVKNAAGAWQQSAKLVANDGSAGDDFGAAVSLSEDGRFALVGAPRDDDKGTDSGSAYVFGINPAGQWQQLRKVAASDGSAGDVFGSYLDLSAAGAVAVIGAPEGGEKGAVYVFTAATSGPTTIFPGTPGDDNYCGANGGDQAAGAVNDSMTGLAGNDCFSPKGGLDTVFGGPGTDFLDYSAASAVFGAPPAGAVINLASGVSSDPWGNPDYTLELENAQGTELGDWLVGTEGDNALTGLGGADTAVGFGGADTIDLGEGADQAYGYAGNDSIKGGAGDDLFYGMEGADSLAGDGDNDLLVGGIDNDTLTGGLGNDSLFGETGDDSIDAGVGSDVADGGPGNDRIELGGYLSFPFWWSIDGNDSGFGGDGDDTIAGGGGDLLMGQGGNDVLLGDVSAAPTFTLRTLIGGDGNDVLFNGRNFANPGDVATGPANLFADAGDDTVIGGHSSDVADGGAGNDSLHAGGGADIVNGGRGVDQMAGGAGSDTFVISSVLSGTSAAAPDVITDFQGAGTSLAGDQDYLLLQTQSGNLATASFTHLGAGLWQFSDGAFSTFVQILAGGGVPVTALLGPGYADTADFGIF
jgi:Ca2+-binding RTX toxin-like protein